MRTIRLASEIDFTGWRNAARALILEGVVPEEVEWVVGDGTTLFAGSPPGEIIAAPQFTVPRAFVGLAERAILHADPSRFALLHRLLWRLRREPRLLEVASDADLVRARAMKDAVDREIHKTHAFVRFRQLQDSDGAVYVAWFEPTHHTLEASAPFFVRRFANMRWSILTPRASAHWDGERLQFGHGTTRSAAGDGDELERLWRTYYASIFNPARLKTHSMQAHMPRKYWRNLPEAELIGALVAGAPEATGSMIERSTTAGSRRIAPPPQPRAAIDAGMAELPADATLEVISSAAARCTRCPLHASATQTVFGEGPPDAPVMMVGEQPGDQEDLAGRPFVGPAGQLFDRALVQAGVDRQRVYVTNAVKHFKFESRGKRRLHRTPGQVEIDACHIWLEEEMKRLEPRLIVTLGATAANAVLGKPTPIQRNRGRLIPVSEATHALITVHPSYLLRIPEEAQASEFARFVQDLTLAREFLVR